MARVTPHGPAAISVVIPTCNRRTSLERTLRALGEQTLDATQYEVVVVADGCVDETTNFVARFASRYSIALVEQNPGRGPAAARNAGARRAIAPLILFIDDDMEADPGLLAAHVEAHRLLGDAKIALLGYFPMSPTVPGDSPFTKSARAWWEREFASRAEPGHRFTFKDFCTGNVSLRREHFFTIGEFDEHFHADHAGEDYEFGYRLLCAGTKFHYLPTAASIHHTQVSLAAALRRREQEGRGQAVLLQKHPELFAHFDVSRMCRLADSQLLALIWRVCWNWPAVPATAAAMATCVVSALEWTRCHRLMWYFFGSLQNYRYWKGVRETLGKDGWERFVKAVPLEVPARHEIDIDLESDGDRLEAKVDGLGVDAIRVWRGGIPLGRIAPVPGAEPLSGSLARNLIGEVLGDPRFVGRQNHQRT